MRSEHKKMLSLFSQNSIALTWVKTRKQVTKGLEYDRLVMDEMTLIKDRLRIISKIPIELLIAVSYQKTVAA